MAELLGEEVGGTVGYSVRLDSKRSARTRIEVITEGLLTRRLITDPELSGVGLVIFDEFHERSIHSDVSLSLTLESIAVLRPDLKVIVMSATLGESLPAHVLKESWRYSFEGTPFPVTTHYQAGEPRTPVWERVASAVKSAISQHQGDILAFLPGAFEIQRTREILERGDPPHRILPLYGDLPYHEQSRAIHPDPEGRRKIILATTIAETSLTIEGVRVVVDSGIHKVARVDSAGNHSLVSEPITRDAADQRAGRAGRTAPGVCIRLWSEQDHRARRPYREPEILRSDLIPCLLDLAAWGISSPKEFGWITPPPTAALDIAVQILRDMGAIDESGAITPHGRSLAQLGAHPTLGAIALASRGLGLESAAASVIALLEERDLFAGRASTADILARVDALSSRSAKSDGVRRIIELRARWLDRITALPKSAASPSPPLPEGHGVATLIALAYPGKIARRREPNSPRYLLASGRGATLADGDPLAQAEFLAVCVAHDASGDMAIRLAAPLPQELFKRELAHLVTQGRTLEVNESSGALTCLAQSKVGAVLISSKIDERPSNDELASAFASWLSGPGFERIPLSQKIESFRARVAWAASRDRALNLPDLSRDTLRDTIASWLIPNLPHPPTLRSITEEVVHRSIEGILSWSQRRDLDEVAPHSITLPGGRARPLTYTSAEGPSFEARIQDLFGVAETPRIGRYRIPAIIHLLSPAHRPVQVTSDLASFWRSGYQEVRKELRGRYPKHRWPENPLEQND
jgi:ATP-dependent helicase HrpB